MPEDDEHMIRWKEKRNLDWLWKIPSPCLNIKILLQWFTALFLVECIWFMLIKLLEPPLFSVMHYNVEKKNSVHQYCFQKSILQYKLTFEADISCCFSSMRLLTKQGWIWYMDTLCNRDTHVLKYSFSPSLSLYRSLTHTHRRITTVQRLPTQNSRI